MLCWELGLMLVDRLKDPSLSRYQTRFSSSFQCSIEHQICPYCVSSSETCLCLSATEVKRNLPQVRLGGKSKSALRWQCQQEDCQRCKVVSSFVIFCTDSFCVRETTPRLSLKYRGVGRAEGRLLWNGSSAGLWRRPVLLILSLNTMQRHWKNTFYSTHSFLQRKMVCGKRKWLFLGSLT